MLDHLGFKVVDYKTARVFYDRVLASIGVVPLMDVTAEQSGSVAFCGYGRPAPAAPGGGPRAHFWLAQGDGMDKPNLGLHVAFSAQSRAQVDAFYETALAAGAKDNGAPGLRPHYHPNYYGAFVIDADGHNIEAVHHGAE
ncbi:VOC family protein [Caulobacter sp. NIBR2454]|uniref:VOC family protein n=1 Tax=Caulobacter sp. NIBR2454 TaxID=3015996 RepID=UPI0022B71A90|nr:VOC family protein [Caulobacter sp. NIBR2454]